MSDDAARSIFVMPGGEDERDRTGEGVPLEDAWSGVGEEGGFTVDFGTGGFILI